MYRLNTHATEEQIQILLAEFTVRQLDGQMMHHERPVGLGLVKDKPYASTGKVWVRRKGTHVQHSLGKVAWLLAFGEYPEHNVTFLNGVRDCRKENLARTTRGPR